MADETTPAPTSTVEAIATEIRGRLDAVDSKLADATSEDNLKRLVTESVGELAKNDPEFVRKFKFDAPENDESDRYQGLNDEHVEWLSSVRVGLAGQKRVGDSGAYGGASKELVTAGAAARERLVRKMASTDDVSAGATARVYHSDLKRAMDTAESGYGSQLIGAQYVGSLWEAARREARIAPLIRTFPMSAPTVYLPVEVDFPELLYVSESTASNASNYTTVKTGSQRVSVSASKFVLHQMWSGEMEEDSLIPFVPFLQRQAQLSVAFYQDSLILNGDTTNAGTGNINLDDADPADTKHYLAWDGLRHVGIVDNTANAADAAGALTYEDFYTNLKTLMWTGTDGYKHDWGNPNNPADLVFLMDRSTATRAALLDEVLTVDKYGSNATVLTGEIGNVGRHSIVNTPAMSLTEADGKVSTTGSNNTKGQVVAFNRNGFVFGLRRTLKTEIERIPATDQTRIVYSARWGFGRFTPSGAASGIEAAAVLYNITV